MFKRLICLSFILFILPATVLAQSNWHSWIYQLREQALNEGISAKMFDSVFRDIKAPSPKVKYYSKTQPEKRLTFREYRRTRAGNYRIRLGVKNYKKYHALLNKIGQEYGVDPSFIVTFWGMETSYGNFMGKFPVIQSLATLSYDSNRKGFFRKELLYALRIVDEGHIKNKDFKGEWAGASGQPQFLPSSWYNYAVDYNGDGRKDIWKTLPDVFASIANYLVENGWEAHQPWGVEVNLPNDFDRSLISLKEVKSVLEWQRLGIQVTPGFKFPVQNLEASIIYPDGGPAFMVFHNFRVIMRYNHSTYYAASVAYMADKIKTKIT